MQRIAGVQRIAGLLLALGLATGAWFAVSQSVGATEHVNLARLRERTARFHSIRATLHSGRVDLHLCVDHMGEHFANPNTFSDGKLDPLDPEAMVYADDGHGHLRLVAVEWVSSTPGSLMHIPLHFNPAVGLWVLHAWIWFPNPSGMFADMNPRVGNCP